MSTAPAIAVLRSATPRRCSSSSRSRPAFAADRGFEDCAFRRSRALAPLVAEASAVWAAAPGQAAFGAWEEIGVRLAAAAARFAAAPARIPRSPANAERGVARAVRLIEHDPAAPLGVQALANEARPQSVSLRARIRARHGSHAAPVPQARAPAAGRRPPRDERFARHRHRTRERFSRRVELQSRVPRGVRRGAARASQAAATPPLDASTTAIAVLALRSETALMQNLRPLGAGPSGNTCPKCASQTLQSASMRCMPYALSRWYATTPTLERLREARPARAAVELALSSRTTACRSRRSGSGRARTTRTSPS